MDLPSLLLCVLLHALAVRCEYNYILIHIKEPLGNSSRIQGFKDSRIQGFYCHLYRTVSSMAARGLCPRWQPGDSVLDGSQGTLSSMAARGLCPRWQPGDCVLDGSQGTLSSMAARGLCPRWQPGDSVLNGSLGTVSSMAARGLCLRWQPGDSEGSYYWVKNMMIVAGDYSLAIYEGTEQQILPQLLGSMCRVSGWGYTSPSGGQIPSTLRTVRLPIVSSLTCNSSQSFNGRITENMLCAGFSIGGRTPARGTPGVLWSARAGYTAWCPGATAVRTL
ncbi:hypothetical protein F7725_001445, partial [Dissostichus mawsoni]